MPVEQAVSAIKYVPRGIGQTGTSGEHRQESELTPPTKSPTVGSGDVPAGYVYFVRARTLGLVKIGIAVRPWHRLSDLQVGSPDQLDLIGVIPSDEPAALERELHDVFSYCRSHGEWFNSRPPLEEFISASLDPPPKRRLWRVKDKIAEAVRRRKAEEEAALAQAVEEARRVREERKALSRRNTVTGSRHDRLRAYKEKRGIALSRLQSNGE